MYRLEEADDGQIASIYSESHALWGGGLSLAAYIDLWDEIRKTPWARRNARFLVWTAPDGTVASSMKLYRPQMWIDGRACRCPVLGAIYTPRRFRGHGHARAMIRAVLDEARGRAEPVAFLFSDIGTSYYAALGFSVLQSDEHWGRIPRAQPDPASSTTLRPMTSADLADVVRAHDAAARRRGLAMIRDAEHWDFLWTRTCGFFRRLDDTRIRSSASVVEERGRFTGYLLAVEGRGEWHVREVGSEDGDPSALERVFRAAARRARSDGARRFYAWLPPELAPRLRDWKIHRHPRRRALLMAHRLDPTDGPDLAGAARAAYFSYQDQF